MRRVIVCLWSFSLAVATVNCGGRTDTEDISREGPRTVREEHRANDDSHSDPPLVADNSPPQQDHLAQEDVRSVTGRSPMIGLPSEPELMTLPANAKYVATNGDDSWPGTEDQPWRHLLPSLQKINPGDTLVIRSGTYTATGSSELCGDGISPFGLVGHHGSEGTWTTIMGYPGERPRLYHPDDWQTLYICNSSYVRIRHLEIFGDASSGNTSPANGVYVVGSHHVIIEDLWTHDNGGCGICTNQSNHVTIQGNRVWSNSHWNPYHSSGISMYFNSNEGGGNDSDGFSNRILGNLVWNNFEDDSLGVGQKWGVTDGNGIIIDRNKESGGNGRTLVENNILADNGGPGIMITEAHGVEVINNTLYQNVRTRVPTVMNNGEIGCNGGYDVFIKSNIVVPRKDNPNLFQNFSCRDFSLVDNVWVKSRAKKHGSSNIRLRTGTQVLRKPELVVPAGNWTPLGNAEGRGARQAPR